jgi:hypothetical protein
MSKMLTRIKKWDFPSGEVIQVLYQNINAIIHIRISLDQQNIYIVNSDIAKQYLQRPSYSLKIQ